MGPARGPACRHARGRTAQRRLRRGRARARGRPPRLRRPRGFARPHLPARAARLVIGSQLAAIGVERNLPAMNRGIVVLVLAFAGLAPAVAGAQDSRLPPNSPYLGSVTKETATTEPRA